MAGELLIYINIARCIIRDLLEIIAVVCLFLFKDINILYILRLYADVYDDVLINEPVLN